MHISELPRAAQSLESCFRYSTDQCRYRQSVNPLVINERLFYPDTLKWDRGCSSTCYPQVVSDLYVTTIFATLALHQRAVTLLPLSRRTARAMCP